MKKKTKLLALTLVAAMMLVGAGYAAWTDQFVSSTEVSTGELNVNLVSTKGEMIKTFANEYNEDLNLEDNMGSIYGSEDNLSQLRGNVAYFELHNMYPGTGYRTKLNAVNEGTLPAVISNVDTAIKVTDKDTKAELTNSELYDAMEVNYTFRIKERGKSDASARTVIEGSSKLNNLANDLSNKLVGHYIGPDEELTGKEDLGYNITFEVPTTLGNENNPDAGEKEVINVKMVFDFEQHNMFDGKIKIMESAND